MTKFIAFATATAALFTATAATARDADTTKESFVHNGSTYVYTTKIDGDRRVIDGRAYPAGNGFHLVVRGDEVSGTSGGVPVKFRVASARGAAVETATR
ncbi:MAG: hypothetical protein OSB00_02780 [Sphingomonas bacterium]|nr:hypothetical protein [Sphingomonas bacterium]